VNHVAARWVLVAAVLGTALAYMSDDMLNLAIPWVARDLDASMTDAQWVLNAYYVALVSFVLVAGSVGDIVGHRRLFVAGLVSFSVGALICSTSPVLLQLIAGRFVQGLGAAMLLTAGLALVMWHSAADDRGRSVGLFMGLVAGVPALGPFISGALVDLFSWRWLFVLTLVLPLAALAVALTRVRETPRAIHRRPDVGGALLLFGALSSLSIALITGAAAQAGFLPLALLALAAACGLGFVVAERRAADPLLPGSLLRIRRFVGGNLVWLLACLTSWGAVFFLAVMLQTTLGARPLVAGLLLTPIYVVMMVGAPLAGRVSDRIGPRIPILGGLLLYSAALYALSRLSVTSAIWPSVLPTIVFFGLAMAAFSAPLAALTLGSVGASAQGVASGVNNAVGQLAGLLGVLVLPALAGLAGASLAGPQFAAGYERAMVAMALLAACCVPIAVWLLHTGSGLYSGAVASSAEASAQCRANGRQAFPARGKLVRLAGDRALGRADRRRAGTRGSVTVE
jgi:EmrB/QacA subfamily drug resistance transporter